MWPSNSSWGQHDGTHQYPSSRRGGGGAYQLSTPTQPPNHYNQNQNTNFHHQNQNRNKNKRNFQHTPRAKPKDSENYKIPACPKCHRYFDLNARCPLILSCRHVLCEECVRSFPVGNNIKCYECDALLEKREPSKDVRELFNIHYFVAGQIYYLKPHGTPTETSHIAFQPAGMQINMPKAKHCFKQPTSAVKIQRSTLNVCGYDNCKLEASLRCVECDDTYCEKCAHTVHNLAKGLKTHQILPLTLTSCSRHKQLEDYHCRDCKKNYCAHCILTQGHKDHIYKQITVLEETDIEEFKELHDSCKGVFKNLKSALSKADLSLNKNDPSNIRKTLNNTFAGLHANLQVIESNLLKKLTDSSQTSLQNLMEIRDELLSNIQAVDCLISESEMIMDNKSSSRLNISVLVERMKNATRLPCFFHEEKNSVEEQENFEFDDVWKNIEDYFMPLTCSSKNFKLLDQNEIPDDYKVSDFSETTSHRSNGSKSFISERSINKQNLTNCPTVDKTQRTGIWVKETNQGIVPKSKKRSNQSTSNSSRSQSTKSVINQVSTRQAVNEKEKAQVIVTQVNNPSSIYVQFAKQRKIFENLHETITADVKNLQLGIVDEPKLNNLYIVKNYDSKRPTWCRGKVIGTFEEDKDTIFEVFYIDFGNIVERKRSDFRYTTPDLIKIQPLAYKCKLYDMYPITDDWCEEINNLLLDMLKGDVTMYTLKNGRTSLQVDFRVYTPESDYSVRDTLLFLGHAKMFDHDSTSPIESTIQAKREEVFCNIPKRLAPNTKHTVIITHVINPHNFYVQLHSREYIHIKQDLSRQMSDYYNKRDKNFIYNPKVGMGVALQCTAGGVCGWYRGRITDVKMGSGEVEVWLVDFGNTLWVSWKQIKKLNDHFATETQQMALKVKLTQIEPLGDGWSQESIQHLKQFIESQETLDMIIYSADKFMEVVLLKVCSGSVTSINAEICDRGLAKSTGNLSSIVDWQDIGKEEKEENFTTSMLRTVQGENNDEDECEDLNFRQYTTASVKVILIENPGCLYFHLTENECYMKRLETLHVRLQDFYSKNELTTKDEWEVGDVGIAFNQEDKQYYRVLLNEFDGESYRLFSRDYAFYFKAPLDDIGIINDDFKQDPYYAYRGHFYGVTSIGKNWTLTATDYITEILLEKKNIFFARVGPSVEFNSSQNSTPVVFWYKLLKAGSALEPSQVRVYNVNLQLSKKGLAIKSKDWNLDHLQIPENAKPSNKTVTKGLDITRRNMKSDGRKGIWLNSPPITERNFKATITYIDDCATIYFQSESGLLLAESYQEEMQVFNNYQEPKKVTWEVNDRCSVKYHQNNAWYRGIVVGFTDDNEIKVCMIDYGNIEEVSHDEIRTEILFENEPLITQKIQFHNIYPKNNKFSTSDIDFIHMLMVDKLATVEIVDFSEEPPTAIIKIDSLNINDYLLKSGGNYTSILSFNDSNCKDDDDVLIEEDNSTEFELPRGYRYKEFPTDKYFNVNIINVLDYNKIVFQITGQVEPQVEIDAFENLSAEINEQAESQPQLLDVEVDSPCIALFDQDNKWYRGIIKQVNRPKIVVHFVDFGNFEDVAERDLRVIKPEWLEFPLDQHTAMLNDIEADDDEKIQIMTDHMSTYYDETKRCEIVNRNPLTVNLYEVDTMKLSYGALIENGVF